MADDPKKGNETPVQVGEWQVRRIGDNQLHLTLPSGLILDPDEPIMTIEHVLRTIANTYMIKKGQIPKCCGASEMVA
jgi:hypothetical protein